MRFFWTGETKNFKPIHVAIFLFTVFVFLFWIGAFVHFGMKFGYSVEKIQYYFWGEPDFPSEVSYLTNGENETIDSGYISGIKLYPASTYHP